MDIDVEALDRLLGGTINDAVPADLRVNQVTHDSRKAGPGVAFVAIPGFSRDGADFAPGAIEAGSPVVIAERDLPGLPTIVVPSARAALATVACAVNGDPSHQLTVHGITGTNGKTTTSYVLHSVLAGVLGADKLGLSTTAETVVGTERAPSARTTPEATDLQRTLARMVEAGVTHAVVEVSSHGIALDRFTGTRVQGAIFTNLTRDHLDLHGSMEEYFEAKSELFRMAEGPLVVCIEDEWGRRLADSLDDAVTVGQSDDADYRIEAVTTERDGTRFTLESPHGDLHLKTPLLGSYNVTNVACAVALAVESGLDADSVTAAVAAMPQVPGRFERVAAASDRGFEVVVDYAHTEVGLEAVLQVARGVAESTGGRVVCTYGAAGDRDKAKRPLMGEVASRLADVAVITTDDPYTEDPAAIAAEVAAGAHEANTSTVLDRREAIATVLREAKPGDVVVVAGKGHERVMHLADRDIPFHDATVVGEELARLG